MVDQSFLSIAPPKSQGKPIFDMVDDKSIFSLSGQTLFRSFLSSGLGQSNIGKQKVKVQNDPLPNVSRTCLMTQKRLKLYLETLAALDRGLFPNISHCLRLNIRLFRLSQKCLGIHIGHRPAKLYIP
jgi:hypothetical protein